MHRTSRPVTISYKVFLKKDICSAGNRKTRHDPAYSEESKVKLYPKSIGIPSLCLDG